jgi:glutamate racemase
VLGLFDSGLGGLTVLRRVREALPHQDVLYFADQAHVPYGDRAVAELLRLMQHNVGWLDKSGADVIVPACNTSCAMALEFGWPQTQAPIVDLIESAAIAIERTGLKRIGVVATAATARSGAYKRHILTRVPDADVFEVAAPALAPLVEAGKLHGPEPAQAVADACATLTDVDAVVLGCTHYPLLAAHFESYFGPYVQVIDPATVQAERAADLIGRMDLRAGNGRVECVTNGDLERFTANLHALIPDLAPSARYLQPVNG